MTRVYHMTIASSRFCGRGVFILVLGCLAAFPSAGQRSIAQAAAPTQTEDEETDQHVLDQIEDWEETLRFGIESEVVELLGELTDSRETSLVDEVLELLRERTNPELLEQGLAYFAAIEDQRAEEVAVQLLSDQELSRADIAIEALRYLADSVESPDTETLETVRSLLNVRSERIASQAALTMGSLGDVEGLDAMERAFGQRQEENVRRNIVLGIGRMGAEARPSEQWLLELLDDPRASETLRQYTVDTLGQIGSERAREPLLELLNTGEGMMRAYAISSLVMLDAAGISDELTRALRDDNWRVRQIALEGVAEAQHEQSLRAVRYMALRDPDHRVSTTAVETLGAFDTEVAYEYLREVLTSDSAPFQSRVAAVGLLAEDDIENSLETFQSVLESEQKRRNSRIVHQIGEALSRAEHPGLTDIFREFLEHDDVAMRLFAIQGIGRNGFTEFREEIEELAEENQPRSIQRHASEALERL